MSKMNDEPVTNPLIFYATVPSLQEISAVAISVEVWRRKISQFNPYGDVSYQNLFEKERFYVRDSVQVPYIIEEIVNECTTRMKQAITRWLNYHYYKVFFSYKCKNAVVNYCNELVWYPDGRINYELTAKRLIQCDKLTKLEKYKIACIYCFQEDVYDLWPFLEPDIAHKVIDFDENPLLYYWDCYMKNQLEDIPVTESIEGDMINLDNVDNYWAIEYFWNKLDCEDRILKAIDIIHSRDAVYIRQLIPKLNEEQLNRVIEECVPRIVVCLASEYWYSEYAYQTWLYIRNLITEDQFVSIIFDLLSLEDDPANVASLLYEIWISAPDELKQYVLNNNVEDVVYYLDSKRDEHLKYLRRDIRFLIEVLAGADFRLRNTIWEENWQRIMTGTSSQYLDKLIKLCYEKDDEIILFKEKIMMDIQVHEYCGRLIELGYVAELNDFLSFCSSDLEIVFNLKKLLLLSNNFMRRYILSSDKVTLNRFIKEVFPAENIFLEYKNQIVKSSSEQIDELFKKCEFDRLEDLVNGLQLAETHLSILKQDFTKRCHHIITNAEFRQFEANKWQKFLSWCLNSEEKVTEFKKSLCIDDTFKAIIKKEGEFYQEAHSIMNSGRTSDLINLFNIRYSEYQGKDIRILVGMVVRHFTVVDDFLLWYFESEQAKKDFKAGRILDCNSSEFIICAHEIPDEKKLFETMSEKLKDFDI